MKPTIGITISLENERKYFVYKEYSDAIVQAGGIPYLFPFTRDREIIEGMARKLDGLLLTGGGDINPLFYGEDPIPELGEVTPERDEMELDLVRVCRDEKKPIFGICRGCQMLNVSMGGDLYQDLLAQKGSVLQHMQDAPRNHPSHSIRIKPDSILYNITQKTIIRVNSFHHQAARSVVSPLYVSATANDGVIEAIEGGEENHFVLGVQWHPERMFQVCEDAKKLFAYFVMRCQS